MTDTTDQHRLDVNALNASVSGFSTHLGIVYDEVAAGRIVAHVEAGPQHHQPYGLVHGGLYAAVVEEVGSVAGGVVVMDRGQRVVGTSNTTDFLRAHREGRLDVVATAIHLGRTQHLWDVTITAAQTGKEIARGRLRLAVLDAEREVAGAPL